ncbi:hypothetical protein [Spiroplasma sp. SV19]|uniref:hypothetical protein n=1 Tax=Spiroplasma sp. SV19 TaxID=2570468 RepID=UPI0024B7D1D7|nr:hypothetical protein [Spiroplasma sp. SV19]WHQ37062.1 hypothetical protein E7Y35_04090 [Spiroplasma sp. SV19]
MTTKELENIKPLYANTVNNFLSDLKEYDTLKVLLTNKAKELGIESRFNIAEKNSWNRNMQYIKELLSNVHPSTSILLELHNNLNFNGSIGTAKFTPKNL